MRVCSLKRCKHGGKPQPESNFHKKKIARSGYHSQCKDCMRETNDRYNAKQRAANDWLKIIIG